MNERVTAIILFLNLILQCTVFQYIAIMGVKPDTALVIVVSLGILMGARRGVTIGIAAGLLQDILFGSPLGVVTLSYMLIGYLAGENSTKVFKEHMIVPLIFTVIATVMKYIILIFFGYALGVRPRLVLYIKDYMLVELVYNCVVSIVIYKFLLLLFERKRLRGGLAVKKKRR